MPPITPHSRPHQKVRICQRKCDSSQVPATSSLLHVVDAPPPTIQVMPTKNPAACRRRPPSSESSASVLVQRSIGSSDATRASAATLDAASDVHVAARHAEVFRKNSIRASFAGPRPPAPRADLDALAMLAGEFRASSAGLHVQLERSHVGRAARRWASGISSTCSSTSSTSGERSKLAIGGTKRRIGAGMAASSH